MTRLTRLPLLHLLHLRSPHLQYAHHARCVLALGLNHYRCSCLEVLLPVDALGVFGVAGETATGGCESGSHERGAGEHEADCAAVDAQTGEAVGVAVDDGEVGEEGVVHVLEEEGGGVEGEEGDAVGAVVVDG